VIRQEMLPCRVCGHDTMHETIETRLWFSFFFIPLFPVSRKRTLTRCTECGFTGTHPAQWFS
jgi:uncharacterized Zn finger protein